MVLLMENVKHVHEPRLVIVESTLTFVGQSETDSNMSKINEADESDCSGRKAGKACEYHVGKVRKRWAARLGALGCICKALVAMNQESCCASRRRSSHEDKRSCKSNVSGSVSEECWSAVKTSSVGKETKCCSKSGTPSAHTNTTRVRVVETGLAPRKVCKDGCCTASSEVRTSDVTSSCATKKTGCCPSRKSTGALPRTKGPAVETKPKQACADGCCIAPVTTGTASKDDGCCSVGLVSEKQLIRAKCDDTPAADASAIGAVDTEKGLVGTEHVILTVSGMTCTGCETKLQKSLSSVASIRNIKTSLILARAEFDVDLAAATAVDVIRHLERTTEFKCERITNVGSELDIIPDGDVHEFLQQDTPSGVTSMELVDKKTIRVFFDAKLIGARHLLEEGFPASARLAPPRGDPTLAAGSKHVRHVGLITLLSALLTIPVLVLAWAPIKERPITHGSVSLALASIVQVVVAGPFYPNALKALIFSRMIEMDLLIVLSTSAAYVFSLVSFGYLVSGRPLSTGQFFETSTLLVTLIMVGRFVSALARQKAVESISIRALQIPTAILAAEDGTREKEIDSRLLQYGDIFSVMPDSRVPTDGTVISGSSEVDESMITGESRPLEKHRGSAVVAGSVNGSGTLHVRLTRLPENNTISAIASMVDEAKLSKPKLQEIADKVASYFVPVVILLTLITLFIWIAVGMRVQKQPASEATIRAITYAITVLIVSCPCAIGLAVPMVIVIAGGVAAKHGVIFKSAFVIEAAYKTSHVVFDKTGTLTQGRLAVQAEAYPCGKQDAVRAQLLGLVAGIKHPVSVAIAAYLDTGIKPAQVHDIKTVTGKGVEGTSNGVLIRAGHSRWLEQDSHPKVQDFCSQGYTVFCVVIGTELSAIYALEDSLRPEAVATVAELQRRGVTVSIVSGDDDGAVRSTASKLGIPDIHTHSKCSPADKRDHLLAIMADKSVITIFCGDGTNDAVALAQATIGVHINDTSEVAQSAADAVLVRPSLTGVLMLIDLSKAAVRRIGFNFGWSFVYNLFAILLAAGAFVNARIPPEYAGLGELVSVLPVILIALQLRWAKFSRV